MNMAQQIMMKGFSRKHADRIRISSVSGENLFASLSDRSNSADTDCESICSCVSELSSPRSPVMIFDEEFVGDILRSPSSEDELNISFAFSSKRRLSLKRADINTVDDCSFKLRLLLADQRSLYGTDMMEAVTTAEDMAEVKELMNIYHCSENNAKLIIFEKRFNRPEQQ